MQALIWGGAAVTLVGVVLLAYSALRAVRVRNDTSLPVAEARALLQKTLYVNLGGLAVAFFGLMLVVVGLILA